MPAVKPSLKNPVIEARGSTAKWAWRSCKVFYELNYISGKAIRWRIQREDSAPMAVASIWERFVDEGTCEIYFSFSMLTVNATGHPVMHQFHKPGDEKRSIVVLQEPDYRCWLQASPEQS